MILGKRRRGTVGQARPKPASFSPYLHKLKPRVVKFGTTRKFRCPGKMYMHPRLGCVCPSGTKALHDKDGRFIGCQVKPTDLPKPP